jgi:hypothetical protein
MLRGMEEYMLAVKGIYDGNTFLVDRAIPIKEECEVIITFLDSVPSRERSQIDKERRVAAVNRLVGLTADNPVSLEDARQEKLAKQ